MPSDNQLLIQIVPRLTPARCGVSDYAISVARELETAFGIGTAFAILNSNERCDVPYPSVHCAQSKLLETCLSLSAGRPGVLLIHLSGYGYSADGAPTLLADALAKVRESGKFRSAVYFHELFATGMPWRSAFWYSTRQRKALRKIAEECDLLVTNCQHHADWLERKGRQATPVQVLPVCSGVGEAREITPMKLRKPMMAVFGLAGTRQRAYKSLASLGQMLHILGVEEIVDVGPEFDAPRDLRGIPVSRKGVLAADDIAGLFSHAMFGFASYPSHCLAKSGVFASYCAYGAIPVLAEPFSGEGDGLKDGVHLVSPQTATSARALGFEKCSISAWRWYSEHRLHIHAATYSKMLAPSSNARIQSKVAGFVDNIDSPRCTSEGCEEHGRLRQNFGKSPRLPWRFA